MKRQRFLAKQNRGAASDPGGRRPPPIQPATQATNAVPQPHPNSPLSQLVANGYPPTAESAGTFDRNVAQQWSNNVQQVQQRGQQRQDPSTFAGPARAHAGGQRVTQNPGGRSNIDLGWDPQPPQANQYNHRGAPSSQNGAYQYQTPYGRDLPNGVPTAQRQQYGASAGQFRAPAQYGSPAGQQQFGVPAGQLLQQQPQQPSGISLGGRGPSPARQAPSPQYNNSPAQNYGHYAAGAAGSRQNANDPGAQRAARRPPGGTSQIVFG